MRNMVIGLSALLLAGLAASCASATGFDRLPNQRIIVLSDMHGICSARYIPGVRRAVHQSDYVTYMIEFSSRTVNGSIRGSFGPILKTTQT